MESKIDTLAQKTPSKPFKRACIYVRVSTEEQGENYSPEFQEQEMLRWAERNEYQVQPKHIYRDIGYSGASRIEERMACLQLFEAVARKEFDLVLVWRVDRFFRKTLYLLDAIEKLSLEEIDFVSITEGIDTRNKMAKPMLTLMGLGAELERDGILERTATGRQHAAKAGKWVGGKHPPYGYDVHPEHKTLSINEGEAKIVHRMFEWFVNDRLPTYEIQKRLNAMKIPTKGDVAAKAERAKKREKKVTTFRTSNPENFWNHSTILKILNQQAYTGTYYHGKRSCKKDPRTGKRKDVQNPRDKWIPISCLPIIELSLWEKAQVLLAENKRLSRKNRMYDYLFSGKIYCGECKSPFVWYMKKKFCTTENGERVCVAQYPQSRCRKNCINKAAIPCSNRNISELVLEEKVWDQIESLLTNPSVFMRELQKREERQSNAQTLREHQNEIGQLLVELQKESQRVFELYEKGMLYQESGALDARIKEIEMRREALEKEQRELSSRILSQEDERERSKVVQKLAQSYKRALTNLNDKTKRQIIQTLVERIVVYPKYVTVELRIEPPHDPRTEWKGLANVRNQKPLCGDAGVTGYYVLALKITLPKNLMSPRTREGSLRTPQRVYEPSSC